MVPLQINRCLKFVGDRELTQIFVAFSNAFLKKKKHISIEVPSVPIHNGTSVEAIDYADKTLFDHTEPTINPVYRPMPQWFKGLDHRIWSIRLPVY